MLTKILVHSKHYCKNVLYLLSQVFWKFPPFSYSVFFVFSSLYGRKVLLSPPCLGFSEFLAGSSSRLDDQIFFSNNLFGLVVLFHSSCPLSTLHESNMSPNTLHLTDKLEAEILEGRYQS